MEPVAERPLRRDGRPWASSAVLRARAAAFLSACDAAGLAAAVATPRTWSTPGTLWTALARTTPLDELAAYGRDRDRNTMPDGHVQSQQEHTAALVAGLHALRRGDVAWFDDRAAAPLDDEAGEFLAALAGWAAAAEDGVFRAVLLGGAFHDGGKLVGDLPGVDAENGDDLFRRLLAAAGVPPPYSSLGAVLVRFHDLVRHHADAGVLDLIRAGAAEAGAAGDDTAWALAAVQIAGRASIGHRRLDSATVTAMADLVASWGTARPRPVHLTIVHGTGGPATTARPARSTAVDHVVVVDAAPAGAVTLLNGTRCRFEG